MSRAKPDDVAEFLDQSGLVADMVASFKKPTGNEVTAASHIHTLLPTLRTWADGLGERDRAGLAMALYVSMQAEILHGAAEDQHHAVAVGRRVLENLSRMTRTKYPHPAIIADAMRHLRAGVKRHKLVGVLHVEALRVARRERTTAISKRRIRSILEGAGILPKKKK